MFIIERGSIEPLSIMKTYAEFFVKLMYMLKSFIFSCLLIIFYFIFLTPAIAEEETLILFDASTSMMYEINNEPKYIIVINSIKEVLSKSNSSMKIGMRIIGLSLNQNSISYVLSPKKMCQATQLINPIKLNNVDNIIKNLENIFPLGLSPITYSLKTAIQYDFSDSANPKHIILITDGEEGCGENPCKYIKEITSYRKDIKIDVIIIGEIEDEAQTQLNCLSQHTNGKIIEIDNAQELNSAFYSIVYNYGHSYNFTNNIQQKNNIIKYKSYMFETYK